MIGRARSHAGSRGPGHPGDISAREDHVAVQGEERPGDEILCGAEGIGRAHLLALRGIRDVNPETRSVAEMATDLPLPVTYNKNKLRYACIPGREHEMFHHRAVCHREHHFRAPGGEGTHTFSFTGCQHNALHGYHSSCNI